MTIEAHLPDGRILEFPDETSDEVIDRVARSELGVFDAEGSGYDMDRARAAGMTRDDSGHMGSVAPVSEEEKRQYGLPDDSYVLLKGRQHETWDLAVEAERERGAEIIERGGRYYSVPKPPDPGPDLESIGTAPYQVGSREPGGGERVGVGGAIASAVKSAPDAFQRVLGGGTRAAGESIPEASRPGAHVGVGAGEGHLGELLGQALWAKAHGKTLEEVRGQQQEDIEGARDNRITRQGEQWFREASERLAENFPNVEQGSAPYYAYMATQAMLQMGPAVAATLFTKRPNVGIAIMGGQVGVDHYAEARERGLDPSAAAGEAMWYAATEGLTEKIPLGVLMRGGKSMFSRVVKSGLAEGLQEPVSEALQMGYEAGVLGDDVSPKEAIRRLYDAGVIGFLAGGGLSITTEPFVRRQRSEEPGLRTEGAKAAAREVDPTQPTPEAPTAEEPAAAVDQGAHEAASSPYNARPEPTQAQKEAGNYKTGRVNVQGLDIAVENPRDSYRYKVDEEQLGKLASEGSMEARAARDALREGNAAAAFEIMRGSQSEQLQKIGTEGWLAQMPVHYGYFRATEGRDGDAVDVFVGPNPEAGTAYIVDQTKPNSDAFDEHKVLMGFDSEQEARAAFLGSFEGGFGEKVLGTVTPVDTATLKGWLEEGNTRRPYASQRREGEVLRSQAVPESGTEIPETGKVESFQPGTAYVGSRERYETAEGAQAKRARKPIRREDILAPFLKALGVRLYQGRIPKRSPVQGYFRPRKDTVRVKKHSDLETTAHELAHYLDYNIPEIRQQWTRGEGAREIAAELKSVSYDTTKVYEGFAEFVRLWMTQPEKAAAAAPKFHEWWEGFVARHKHGPAIQRARVGMQEWFDQGLVARAQSKIGPQQNVNEALDSIWDRFRQSAVDDFHGITRMETQLTGERFPVAGGPAETAYLTRGAYAVVDGAIRFGPPVKQPDGSFEFEGKGLKDILTQVDDIDTWTQYAVGRSADELFRQGREYLFTRAEINAMLQLETPEYRKAFEEYQEWNRAVVDFAVAMGVIDPAQRRTWRRQQYIPFYRVGQPGTTKRGQGIEGNVKGWHALTGGTGNIRDVLGNMIQNASMLISESIKNEARMRVVDFAWRQQKGGGKFLEKIPKGSQRVAIDKDQVRDSIYRMLGIDKRNLDPADLETVGKLEDAFAEQPGFMQYWIRGQAPRGDNIVAVLRAGKPEFYEVADPLLFRALQRLDRPRANIVLRGLDRVRRVVQGSITFTLDFMAANLFRDTLHGWVFSRHGFKPFKDSLSGMATRITQDETYREYIANGGGMSSYMVDPDAFKKRLEKWYTGKGVDYRSVIDTPGKLLYALEIMGEAVEMSTRLGDYKRARAGGAHPRHAAYLGREVSTDFARRGDSELMAWLYRSVIFLNAGVQGLDRAYRGVSKDPHRARLATRAGMMAVLSVALYLMNRDDERYRDLEDWDRDTHWHVFVGDLHLRFPKIWEVGAIASAAERTMEAFLHGVETGHVKGAEYAQHLGRIFADLFKMDYAPAALEPLYETYALNEERFTNRPIETRAMQGRQPHARYSEHTSRSLVELARQTRDLPPSLQFSPARMEALIRGYFNTYAMYGLMLSDETFHDEKVPRLRKDQYPVLRRFYREEPYRTRYSTEFWEMYREITELQNTINHMGRQNRPEDFEALSEKELAAYHEAITNTYTQVMNLHRAMDAVYLDDSLNRDKKREELDRLQTELNDLLKQVVTGLKTDMEVRE